MRFSPAAAVDPEQLQRLTVKHLGHRPDSEASTAADVDEASGADRRRSTRQFQTASAVRVRADTDKTYRRRFDAISAAVRR